MKGSKGNRRPLTFHQTFEPLLHFLCCCLCKGYNQNIGWIYPVMLNQISGPIGNHQGFTGNQAPLILSMGLCND